MTLNWFPWYPEDFRRDTMHLTLEEDGAYRRLIDHYMITRSPLPDNDLTLSRILGVPKADWTRIAASIRGLFHVRNDKLYHKRCERELKAQNLRHNRASEKAKKAAFVKYHKFKGLDPPSMPVACSKDATLTKDSNNSFFVEEESRRRAREERGNREKKAGKIEASEALKKNFKQRGWS